MRSYEAVVNGRGQPDEPRLNQVAERGHTQQYITAIAAINMP